MIKTKILICVCVLVISSSTISVSGTLVTDFVADRFNLQSEKIYSDIGNFGDTIYVDDDAPPGGDGSLEHPFRTIEEGIDASSNGDTVFVFEGKYYEHIRINTSIDLIGEDKDLVIIDGGGYDSVVFIKSNRVNVTGFTIQNGGFFNFPMLNAAIYCVGDECTITDNIIKDNLYNGILLYNSSNSILTENIIKDNIFGLYFLAINNCIISNNVIIKNEFGICLGAGHNISIFKNGIRRNKFGIILAEDVNTKVYDNNFIFNLIHATFTIFESSDTELNKNFWGRPRLLKKPILGRMIGESEELTPYIIYDEHPAILPKLI